MLPPEILEVRASLRRGKYGTNGINGTDGKFFRVFPFVPFVPYSQRSSQPSLSEFASRIRDAGAPKVVVPVFDCSDGKG
jgi:hypothetical protein